jgi:hypothetical protein
MSLLSKNKVINRNFILSFILNLLLWIFLYWKIQPQVDPIVLNYNIYFGISLIGDWWHIFTLPLVGLVIWLINLILVAIWSKKEQLLTSFLSYTTTLIQILLIIVSIFMVMVNG